MTVFDNALIRRKRPTGNGSGDTMLDELEMTQAPDITEDLDAIDRALAEAEQLQNQQPTRGCGCW